MPLETFGYLDSLNASNPSATDGIVAGDDHIRGIKSSLLATFPNVAGAVTPTHTQLNKFATGSACLTGMLAFYCLGVPTGAEADWLECNGATYNTSTYPALSAYLLSAGPTFTVPDAVTGGLFLRSHTSTTLAGTIQADALKTHTHTATASSSASAVTFGSSVHQHAGTTAAESAIHDHTVQTISWNGLAVGAGGSSGNVRGYDIATGPSGTENQTHVHGFFTNVDGQHDHSVSVGVTTSVAVVATGDTETRPKNLSAVLYIHT